MTYRRAIILSLETLLAIIVAVMVGAIMFAYVVQQTDATGYFQTFHSKDLSLLANTVAGAPGDLIVTYDNFKRGIPITYRVEQGRIVAAIGTVEQSRPFGIYNRLSVRTSEHQSPRVLTFIKTGDEFIANEAAGFLEGCRLREKTISQTRVGISSGPFREDNIILGYQRATEIIVRDMTVYGKQNIGSADIIFRFMQEEAGQEEILIQYNPETPDTTYLACLLTRQLQAITVPEVRVEATSVQDNEIFIIFRGIETVEEELLGQAIGRSMGVYARE